MSGNDILIGYALIGLSTGVMIRKYSDNGPIEIGHWFGIMLAWPIIVVTYLMTRKF